MRNEREAAAEVMTEKALLEVAANYQDALAAVAQFNALGAKRQKELTAEVAGLSGAIEEARERDKPILLWIMNGHPCGMT